MKNNLRSDALEFYDTHAHSLLSFDSEEDPKNYLIEDTRVVALTDHLEMDYAYVEGNELIPDFDQIPAWQKEWDSNGKELLMGVEIGYSKGNAKRLKQAIALYSMDLKLLSTHHNNTYDYMDENAEATPEEMIDSFLIQTEEAVDHFPEAQIFCHFDYGFRIFDMSLQQFKAYEERLVPILQKVIEYGLAFELNSKSIFGYENLDLYEHVIPIYQELGGRLFSIGSDAHKAEEHYMEFGNLINLLDKHQVETVAQFYQQELSHYPLKELKKRF
jgi:histidinol-phosphatase (PHP family)